VLHGTILTPLRIIPNPLGSVYHALKRGDPGYADFGEVYFSLVETGAIKGWKRHRVMVSNLVVPAGEVRIVAFDDRADSPTRGQWMDVRLGPKNYHRLTLPPGLWFAFQGTGAGANLMMNLASILHDPAESDTLALDDSRFAQHVW
jgi:dTDP-4-dehydrorhamnose 3,5-epimerase